MRITKLAGVPVVPRCLSLARSSRTRFIFSESLQLARTHFLGYVPEQRIARVRLALRTGPGQRGFTLAT